MNRNSEKAKQELLDQVSAALVSRISAKSAELGQRYVESYFRRVPLAELASQNVEVLAAMLASQLKFMAKRQPGESLLRVYNPSLARDGWESKHTIVEMVNDDKPFLVDSATLALAEMGLDIHLIVHPVIKVRRGKTGNLLAISNREDKSACAESVVQIQFNHQSSLDTLRKIQQQLKATILDVELAVRDWQPLTQLAEKTGELMPKWAPQADAEVMAECQEFMSWLVNNHFIFLGARDYDVVKVGKQYELHIVPGSGLGILEEDASTVMARPLSKLAETARTRSANTPLIITKTNSRSTVHRVGYMDYIGVLRYDKRGNIIGERRIIGLFTSSAYALSVMETPLVRGRVKQVVAQLKLHPGSHAWKTLMHILETLPRDELLQANADELAEIAEGVLNLQERRRVRLFIRREQYGRFYSCLVYIPRERFNTENREKIQSILNRALKGKKLDYVVNVSESALARLHVIIRPEFGVTPHPEVPLLEQKIVDAVHSWTDELTTILVQQHGEEKGLRLAKRFCPAFPEAYKEDVSPWVAGFDVENAAAVDRGEDLRMSLYRPRKVRGGMIRFKLFRRDRPIALSEVLPMLENLGLSIISERPYELEFEDQRRLWIQDFDMVPVVGRELNLESVRSLFEEAFRRALTGDVDSDGFNQLVIAAELNWRQVKVLRAYCKYLLQIGTPFSQAYMAETLAKYPAISRILLEMFEAMFDPDRDDETDYRRQQAVRQLRRVMETLMAEPFSMDEVLAEYLDEAFKAREKGNREDQVQSLRAAFQRALTLVTSLDEDRILYSFYDIMRATLRTSFFRRDENGEIGEYISFKIESGKVADLPLPKPYREIWVYSPRFEGIHLRGGKIARGGLRWSDRREDFRTEVLGLMKAQNVKNTMIVPVGAKGGFVLKRAPTQGGREAIQQEGVYCYKRFINALLDITDNLSEDKVLHPENVVRRDEDDPYLVVAADKGTATFSDLANSISLQRGFWLADAFASGGSVGYDHKGMGITAKGAWEGVKRHFRELGIDIQKQPFTVVGIGDMSGDVFGNGMLLSKKICLKAAFNHLHIFLDPDPDPKTSFAERQRLFRKPRSGWDDYNPEKISKGGGVYSRLDKTIPLSKEIREWLDVEAEQLAPHELIKLLLKAPVDLLWNGGIGTYVKSSKESNADVGDMANNTLRVNGNELGCRVVGEGGNLGCTQPGRIEFAMAGGRINTDFIDNSAGVDTSDHEVNIKILLAQAIRTGKLKEKDRPALLASMTDEVAELVLRSNYLQTQAISMMETMKGPRMGSKQHFVAKMEEQGIINRQLEFLPDDDQLTERRARGEGLTRPELSVLLSYSKIVVYQQLLASDLHTDPYLSRELIRYFPQPLQKRFAPLMEEHRLRREIIATQVTNSMVNRMGVSFCLRMQEDTNATPASVAKAYTIAREIFHAREFWAEVESLDNKIAAQEQTRALLTMWNVLRQSTRWVLIRRSGKLDVSEMVDRWSPGLKAMEQYIVANLSPADREVMTAKLQSCLEAGMPESLAARIALLEFILPALDVVETAAQRKMEVEDVAHVYFRLGDLLHLKWLREQLEGLPVKGQWHAHARAILRDELFSRHNELVDTVLRQSGRSKDSVGAWLSMNEARINPVISFMNEMADLPEMDYATLSVAVRSLAQMLESDNAD
ncbi:MAG TPA: NAD-glutamate dehydrogenase [Xanthomonadales bacterium]|nr:NAD-glutamate dehydrogenase [Xanthomonadales bacterium]